MTRWFAGRRGQTRGVRRTAVRGVLAAVVAVVLASTAGLTVVVAGASAGGSRGSTPAAARAGAGRQAGGETSPAVTTFEADFNGPSGDPPNPTKWTPKIQTRAQSRTGEIQYYTRDQNAFLDGDGHLVIEARKVSRENCPDPDDKQQCYTSARLSTKGLFSQQGGRFAARIKMPIGNSPATGGGVWPAWWLLGRNGRRHPDQGEVDISESTGAKSYTHGFFHALNGSGGGVLDPPGLDMNEFNTFAVDIEPSEITWYINDTKVRSLTRAQYEREHPRGKWVAEQPWYLILNLAVGGWPGPPSDSLPFPKKMVVDWVRASCPHGAIPFGPEDPASQDESHLDKERVRCAPSPGQ